MCCLRDSRRAWCAGLFALLLCAAAPGDDLEFSISPSPVGSGARAAGMADAFVAIADDATAASWNPAGLIQLERPEIAAAGALNALFEDFRFGEHDEANTSNETIATHLNFLSFTYPLPLQVMERNLVVGLYLQNKYDFNREFRIPLDIYTVADGSNSINHQFSRMKFTQEGSLNAITPALAFEVTQRLSVGLALNIYRELPGVENSWKQTSRATDWSGYDSAFTFSDIASQREEYDNFRGQNLTVGAMWEFAPSWKLGLRYDSRMEAEVDYRSSRKGTYGEFGSTYAIANVLSPALREEKRTISFPSTVAVGLAKRLGDRNTISVDVSRTDWSDFWVEDSTGRRASLVNGATLNDRKLAAPEYDPTYTVRAGFEHLFIPRQLDTELNRLWSVRCGASYDPEPATKGRDDFYTVAVGGGVLLKQRVNLDAAYQVRFGRGVNSDFIRGVSGGFQENVVQHRFLLSTVVYF